VSGISPGKTLGKAAEVGKRSDPEYPGDSLESEKQRNYFCVITRLYKIQKYCLDELKGRSYNMREEGI
jgi:hypothetical protein